MTILNTRVTGSFSSSSLPFQALKSGQVIKRLIFVATVTLIVLVLLFKTSHVTRPPEHPKKHVHTEHAREVSALDLWRIRGPDAQKKLGQLFEGVVPDEVPARFRHEYSFHIPPDPITLKHCPPAWLLQDLANDAASNLTFNPLIFHFQNESYISDTGNKFPVGTEFCSVILAPQPPKDESNYFAFHNTAIEGWGPDSIHCEVASNDIRLIPPHPDYYGSLSIRNPQPSSSAKHHVEHTILAAYTIPYVLNHPGIYQFSGEVEFQSYDWVMEDPIDVGREQHDYYMIENPLQLRSPAINIVGEPVARPHQKCHFDGFNDLQGRWYRASSFTRDGNQTKLNPTAHLEFAEHNNTVDEWGWTFAPDACSLTYFTPSDHAICLANRTIQILGDSNSRRLTKSLIGGGLGWCTDPHDRYCQCEDTFEDPIMDMNWKPVDTIRFRDTALRDMPIVFGSNSSVYFDFVGGVLNAKLFNPWSFFYDRASPSGNPSPGDPPQTEDVRSDAESSIIDRRLRNSTIDIVHISLLGWDIAAIRTPSQVLASLPAFRNTLLRQYPPGTRFITRMANSMCCGNQNHRTRYSAPRFRMWNAMWRDFWARDEAAGRVRVDDAAVLQGRRDAETAYFCPTTHFRGSHIRIEQMMWMGTVCEKAVSVGSHAMGEDARPDELTLRPFGYTKEDVMMAGPGINELKATTDSPAPV